MERLDKRISFLYPEISRSKAAGLIKDGRVKVNSQLIKKPSFQTQDFDLIEVFKEANAYVSRAGRKLEAAIEEFKLNVEGLVCLDVGASTGGFTECLLRNGAAKVYALDVGSSQLDSSLKNNHLVVSLENTNARYMDVGTIGEIVDFVSVDVSFISLTLVLPAIKNVLKPFGKAVLLVKPQFEAGKKALSKGGVVKREVDRQKALARVRGSFGELNIRELGFIESPVTGTKGNIEYLILVEF